MTNKFFFNVSQSTDKTLYTITIVKDGASIDNSDLIAILTDYINLLTKEATNEDQANSVLRQDAERENGSVEPDASYITGGERPELPSSNT